MERDKNRIRRDSASRRRAFLTALVWLLATLVLGGLLLFRIDAALIGAVVYGLFAVVLTIYLALTPRPSTTFSGFTSPKATLPGRFTVIILGFGILIGLSLVLRQGAILVVGSALVALWLIVRQRQQMRMRQFLLGGLIGLFCGLATLLFRPGDLFLALLYTLTTPLLFVAGNLLLTRTALTQVRILHGQMRQALRSFMWAGILSVPLILLNLLGGISPTEGRIDQWWEPFYAFVPALSEEVWARLFLITLGYAWLRPVVKAHSGQAIGFAVLLAALAHGLAHYPATSVLSAVMTGLVVGVPLGMLFISRDWESAVGYHFFPVFARFVMIFLQA